MDGHIDEQQVRHIAPLARLKLTDEEVSGYVRQLEAILEYVEKLERLDTEGLEPTAHPLPVQNVFSDDEARRPCDAEQALLNAPATRDGLFKVPKVREEAGGA